mgnify:FL=1
MSSKFSSQIKYLYKTSLQIIREFGIKYYLNFGITQLKHQKLNLFLTKENDYEELKNNSILNKRQQYEFWKEEKNKKLENSIEINNFQILLLHHFL